MIGSTNYYGQLINLKVYSGCASESQNKLTKPPWCIYTFYIHTWATLHYIYATYMLDDT